jgi:PleD family two-component response regulator
METPKVLVINDHEAQAQGLSELLTLAGFQSGYALTGKKWHRKGDRVGRRCRSCVPESTGHQRL